MKLIKQEKISYQVQEITDDFLSMGIPITEKEILELFDYQQALCDKLDWMELHPKKMQYIIQPFLYSKYLPYDKYMYVLKTVIHSYYHLRESLDYHTSDEKIIDTLFQIYYDHAGLYIDTLFTSTKNILLKEGGAKRNEQFDTME